jgi:hypothetical protein
MAFSFAQRGLKGLMSSFVVSIERPARYSSLSESRKRVRPHPLSNTVVAILHLGRWFSNKGGRGDRG